MVRSSHCPPMGERVGGQEVLALQPSHLPEGQGWWGSPNLSAPQQIPQRPVLTLWSVLVSVLVSVGPVSTVGLMLAACSRVQAMMGEVKVSLGLRAGCRLTLLTCWRAQW